jgi:hypothetical protein
MEYMDQDSMNRFDYVYTGYKESDCNDGMWRYDIESRNN